MNKVRTRFAPSPTGYMHIGNLRTALFTYLIAKQNGGDFILRIEDTDQERYVDGAVEVIYKTLKDVGLNWDEGPDIGGPVGPYIQSQRMGMFKKYAEELVEKGEAYYCFCDKERLEEVRAIQEASGIAPMYDRHCRNLSPEEIKEKLDAGVPYVIRQKIPTEGEVTFHDELYGDITVDCSTLDDQILIKTVCLPITLQTSLTTTLWVSPTLLEVTSTLLLHLSITCSIRLSAGRYQPISMLSIS